MWNNAYKGIRENSLKEQERRMFNEHKIRDKAFYGSTGYSVDSERGINVGDNIKIYKKHPHSSFYDYGNNKGDSGMTDHYRKLGEYYKKKYGV